MSIFIFYENIHYGNLILDIVKFLPYYVFKLLEGGVNTDFLDKLETLMSKHSIKNKKQLAMQSGIPYTTIVNWYKRGYENMTISNFKTLCNFFCVTMDCMARDEITEIEYYNPNKKDLHITMEEEHILKCYRAADNMHKGLAQCAIGADEKGASEKGNQDAV